MSAMELRDRIKQKIDALPEKHLEAAAELLDDLVQEEDATVELQRIPGFATSFEEGLRAMKEDKVTPVEQLRRKD